MSLWCTTWLTEYMVTTGVKVTERRVYVVAEDADDAKAIVQQWLEEIGATREKIMRTKPVKRQDQNVKYLARKT